MEHEVVISGIAGRFPGCDDVESLKEMLFNKISGVTSDNRRWEKDELGVPHYLGKINDPYSLDLTFFGIHSKLGESMDPQNKLILQVGFSAICDAGVNPSDLAGSNTATLIGSSLAETEYDCIITKKRLDQTILSHAVSMQAHRIAYYLDLRGPSYVCDSSWNGGLYVLRYARDEISKGSFSAALVTCTNLIFMPQVSYHYNRLGRLNEDGKTKCFSDNADGYTRSEGCVSFFLQRKEHALRTYGTVIGANNTLYASKNSPLSDCSDIPIVHHLQNLYDKCKTKVKPSEIEYLEASGCASKVVDASELNAVAEVFLPKRNEPLLIGSIKSNIGHTEAASGFMGILKAVIASECGLIPPNINYSNPNSMVPSLISGKLKVVKEATPLKGEYIAVNNISASGDFGHVIIKRNTKTKKRETKVGVLPPDKIPRLVLLSGRVENGLEDIIKKIEEMPIDEEFIALTHNVFGKGIKNHIFRGYTILDEGNTDKFRQIKPYQGGERRPLWFIFTGMGSQWAGVGAKLMKLPVFAKTIEFCQKQLEPMGIDVMGIITKPDQSVFNNILNAFVGITAIQVAFIDIINHIGLIPDGIIGHSFGELACAYCDGTITAKQAILTAYNRGKISTEAKVTPGLMAAIGLGYQQLKDFGLPENIDVACHNSHDSCTISGPAEDVKKFVDELQEKGIFARSVPTGGMAYHSRYIKSLGPIFRDELKKIISEPKIRSSKWISSSVPEEEWETELGKYSSAEYHTNNLLNSVLFEEACAHVPKNAIVVEIAPHGLLQAILKRILPSATHIPLTNRTEPDSLKFMLAAFGKMFTEGVHLDISKLYPPVEFPVSRGTPSLEGLLNWSSAGSFKPWTFLQRRKNVKVSKEIIFSNTNPDDEKFMKYTINKVPFIPIAAYINAIMKEFVKFKNEDLSKIVFHEIKVHNLVRYNGDTDLYMTFQRGSGTWEICKENKGVITGNIDTYIHKFKTRPFGNNCENLNLTSSHHVYSHLLELGLAVPQDLQLIKALYIDDCDVTAEIVWNGDWSAYLDSVFKIVEFIDSVDDNKLRLITNIERITLDLSLFSHQAGTVHRLIYNAKLGLIWGKGIEILYPLSSSPNLPLQKNSVIERKTEFLIPKFTPYQEITNCTESTFYETCLKIMFDNLFKKSHETYSTLHVIEILENITIPDIVYDILKKQNNIKIKVASASSDTLLQDIKQDQHGSCLIISGSSVLENALKVLSHFESGFLIYKGDKPPPNLALVNSQKIQKNNFFFCKSVKRLEEQPAYVLFDSNWICNLRKSLDEEKKRLTFLIAPYFPLPAIQDIVEQSKKLKNSHLLRHVFIDATVSSFKAENYEDYIQKDLFINIFSQKKWGTFLLYPVISNFNHTMEIMENRHIFQFSNVKCYNFDLVSLGLNLSHTSITAGKEKIYEYSGRSQGEEFCGLATLNEGNLNLQQDPHYFWIKPKNLTHEEVTSAMLFYLMAYYILEFDVSQMSKQFRSILIHDGMSPLSQAIINIAIKRGFDVFITYNGIKENKEYLKKKYPELNEKHIINYNSQQLEVPLLFETKGAGVDLVINTLKDSERLKKSLKCLGKRVPRFFQVVMPSMPPGFSIGLSSFLNGAGLHCFYFESLLSLPLETKKVLSHVFGEGLKKGEVKPILYNKISPSAYNIDVINEFDDVKNKMVVSLKETHSAIRTTKAHIFDSSKSYFIIGDQEDGWFTLLDWLITRGARKFILAISKFSSSAMQKINTLLTIHDHISLTTQTLKKSGSQKDLINLLNGIQNYPEIDTAFVIGKENQRNISEITTNFPETRVIGICNGSGILQEILSINPRILIIKTPKITDYKSLLGALDSLMSHSGNVICMNHWVHKELDADTSALQHWQHIPTSLKEILSVARCTKRLFWKEIRTSSPSYKYCREISPVFVLPSLKKGQMKHLLSSLFHPAFEAVLPSHFDNTEELTQQLLLGMKSFSCSVFTIICSDWTWLLGLKLGILLEQSGRNVSLILLGVSPQWATPESVKRIYVQTVKEISPQEFEAYDKAELEKGLAILQDRVHLISSTRIPEGIQFKGLCHLVTFTKPNTASLQQLTMICQRNINVFLVEERDYLSMLNSNVTSTFINENILFELKDNAKVMSKPYENVIDYNLLFLEE